MSAASDSGRSLPQNPRGRWLGLQNLTDTPTTLPPTVLMAWMQTVSGVVLMLVLLQLATGLLLAFYYVPSADHAYTTVSFIEKVLPAGSWFRALHQHGSTWLTAALFLDIVRLFWFRSYEKQPFHWLRSVFLLALILAAGATGYSLPWDARAFFSTRVAGGLAASFPLVGQAIRRWLLDGNEISTLTLSRFFALHVFVTPILIFLLLGRLFLLRGTFYTNALLAKSSLDSSSGKHLVRTSIVAGTVFLALAIYSQRHPASLGPSASTIEPGYLPRPGAQFLWLYQILKFLPGRFGSLIAVGLPALILLGLAILPFLQSQISEDSKISVRRMVGAVLLSFALLMIVSMTTAAYLEDRCDPRTRQQLERQAVEEANWRSQTFVPAPVQTGDIPGNAGLQQTSSAAEITGTGPPQPYTKLCATCHGEHGEGARQGPLKFPSLLGISAKPRRTSTDIIALLEDPKAYGLDPPMKSFAGKLNDAEKREIAEWIVNLKR